MTRTVTVRFIVEGGGDSPALGDTAEVHPKEASFLVRRGKAELFTPVEEVKAEEAKPKKKVAKQSTTKKKKAAKK